MLLACLATILVSTGVMADTQPFNLSLTPNIAVYPRSDTIEGLTLSVWGENQQTSLALGIANGSVGNSAGLDWGLINYAYNYKGLKKGACENEKHVKKSVYVESCDFRFPYDIFPLRMPHVHIRRISALRSGGGKEQKTLSHLRKGFRFERARIRLKITWA